MNLVDDNMTGKKSNKKIFIICGVLITLLIFVIVGLLAVVSGLNKGTTLSIDGKKYNKNGYLKIEDDTYYIQIQGLVNSMPANGYSYKKGNPDVPDFNGCYITNSVESTYFKVNSKEYYKILKKNNGEQEIKFYSMEKPVKEIDGEIYMPVSAVERAANADCVKTDKSVTIESIGYIEGKYNQPTQNKTYPYFKANDSIEWNVSYSNSKLLRDNIVVIKDNDNASLLGLSVVGYNNTGKGKKITHNVVLKDEIVSPRYISIEYVEKFDLLIVETEDGKGILKLVRDDAGNVTGVKNVISPQYTDITPINSNLFVIAEKSNVETTDNKEEVRKYGIINATQDRVLPTEYEQIGIEKPYQLTNNNINSEYIINSKYIPVKKNGLWGIIDTSGNEIIKPTYDAIGCMDTNASSNVIIIPEFNAFVFKSKGAYGITTFKGESLLTAVVRRIYIDTSKSEKTYSMIYKEKTYNVITYLKKKQEEKNGTKTTNTTNTTKTTNTTNTTKSNTVVVKK